MKKVELELQDEMSECGLACASMILNSYDVCTSLSDLRRQYKPDISGLSLYDIENILFTYGITACSYEIEFENIEQLNLPAIVQWRHQHFVVLSKVTKKYIEVYDPALGRRRYYNKTAKGLFSGYIVNIEEVISLGITKKNKIDQESLFSLAKKIDGLSFSICITILLMIIVQLFYLLTPKFLSLISDFVINKSDVDMLIVIVIGFSILYFFDYLAQSILTIIKSNSITEINNNLSSYSYKILVKQPVGYFQRRNVTDIVKRLSIINGYGEHLVNNYINLVVSVIFSITFLSMIHLISTEIGLMVALIALIYTSIRMIFIGKVEGLQSAATAYDTNRNEQINSYYQDIKSNKINARESFYLSELIKLNKRYLNNCQKLNSLKENGASLSSIANNIATIFVIYFFVKDIFFAAQGDSSIGNMFLLFFYKEFFFRSITNCIDSTLEIKRKEPDFKLILSLINQKCEMYSLDKIIDKIDHIEQISIKNGSLSYSSFSEPVFENLSISINKGDKIAIIGKSGKGKTSLAAVLSSITELSNGEIYVNNNKIEKFGIKKYRKSISVSFADDTIQNTSVQKNIIQEQEYDKNHFYNTLLSVGLIDEVNNLHNGVMTLLGNGGVQLSSGQKQRLCIARALYKKHDVLILDEPTSHLDSNNSEFIYKLIKNHQGICIVITHDKTMLNYVNSIFDIEELAC